MTPKPKDDEPLIGVDGPAVVTELHVLSRPATDDDMRPLVGTTAWRKLSKVANLKVRGYLDGGHPGHTAQSRLDTAVEYAKLIDTWGPTTTDSTQKLNVSRSTGGGGRGDAAIDAGTKIEAIKRHLGIRDKAILEFVFVLDWWPAEAVKAVCCDYEDSRPARFREALDALAEAMAATPRRVGGGLVR